MKKILFISLILFSFFVFAEDGAQKTDANTGATEKKAAAEPKAAPEKGKVYEGMPITPEFSK